jgi:hypothetical protein
VATNLQIGERFAYPCIECGCGYLHRSESDGFSCSVCNTKVVLFKCPTCVQTSIVNFGKVFVSFKCSACRKTLRLSKCPHSSFSEWGQNESDAYAEQWARRGHSVAEAYSDESRRKISGRIRYAQGFVAEPTGLATLLFNLDYCEITTASTGKHYSVQLGGIRNFVVGSSDYYENTGKIGLTWKMSNGTHPTVQLDVIGFTMLKLQQRLSPVIRKFS